MGSEGLLQLNLNSSLRGRYGGIKPEFAGTSLQPSSQVSLTGSGCIRFVSVVFAIGAAFGLFETFLQIRRTALNREVQPVVFAYSLVHGFALTVMAFLLWSYAGAIRDYSSESETAARRLERAHIDTWRWGAIFLAAHLVLVAVVVAVRMPF
jgi:hypothetical protein